MTELYEPLGLELRCMRTVTTRLPRMWGVGNISNALRRLYNRKRREMCVAPVFDFKMMLDPHEDIDGHLLFAPQLYDPYEVGLLQEVIQPGGLFVDIGANIGFYSLVASGLVGPAGRVIAVEAVPSTFEQLKFNIDLNSVSERCTLVNQGVSDREEVLELAVPDGESLYRNRGANSFLHPGSRETTLVDCGPLKQILDDYGVERISAMKVDIEGFEWRVFSSYLADVPDPASLPQLLVIEQRPNDVARDGDTVRMLIEHGYTYVHTTRSHNVVLQLK